MKTKGTVKDSLTVEHETYDTLIVCIGVVYCLSILFIQLITEITSWLLRSIPSTGNIYRSKRGVLRCFWIPTGGNYSTAESEDLTGWYDVPDLEDIEEWTFDSCCPTPAGDDVEHDHPDSWLRILSLV